MLPVRVARQVGTTVSFDAHSVCRTVPFELSISACSMPRKTNAGMRASATPQGTPRLLDYTASAACFIMVFFFFSIDSFPKQSTVGSSVKFVAACVSACLLCLPSFLDGSASFSVEAVACVWSLNCSLCLLPGGWVCRTSRGFCVCLSPFSPVMLDRNTECPVLSFCLVSCTGVVFPLRSPSQNLHDR